MGTLVFCHISHASGVKMADFSLFKHFKRAGSVETVINIPCILLQKVLKDYQFAALKQQQNKYATRPYGVPRLSSRQIPIKSFYVDTSVE